MIVIDTGHNPLSLIFKGLSFNLWPHEIPMFIPPQSNITRIFMGMVSCYRILTGWNIEYIATPPDGFDDTTGRHHG